MGAAVSGRRAAGLKAWVYQRISAVYLAGFLFYLIGFFILTPPASYDVWRLWVAQPHVSMAWLLFFISLLLHAWVGIRNVLIDYIHPFELRFILLTLTGLGLIACGVWSLQIVILARIA
ncbi:Succinate dehydrogenase hydrophobic membrane anchor protein [hydrothermal vent metagenome]|uniref:Succinate dehydrogenase hydrophobic membrane anchor protein n=1 Tax=hydrothermal vent metagenome TaxID=652676 RepID=A0A3B1BGS8_9ZZZZ